MLFNSYAFIFAFLPFVLAGYAAIGRWSGHRSVSLWWLVLCSVVFYAIWNPVNLVIIGPSVAANFMLARLIERRLTVGGSEDRWASVLLVAGVILNMCFLGYFKYRNFFLDSVNHVFATDWPMIQILLPLGISFITFQKIAFLVDVRMGAIRNYTLLDFLIFVVFFPQLIAGPIVHYREMVPQFHAGSGRLEARDLCVGLSLFALGLFKKAVLADGIAPYASTVFAAAERGDPIGLVSAWLAAAAFTLQVYFDFSGYSDMAIGLGRMFGVRLPVNFDSPLKASSIVDFWNRWHMTLTRFLTAYVYAPISLALTRRRMASGKPMISRKRASVPAFAVLVAVPTVVTMFASGLWHGAGITYVLFGLLHGFYLVVNQAWRQWHPRWPRDTYDRAMKPLGLVLTLLCVFFAMGLFKASTLRGGLTMQGAMLGFDGVALPQALLTRLGGLGQWLQSAGVTGDFTSGSELLLRCLWVAALLLAATVLPNSLETMARFEPALGMKAVAPALWQATLAPGWAAGFALLMLGGLLSLNRISEFLYWQF